MIDFLSTWFTVAPKCESSVEGFHDLTAGQGAKVGFRLQKLGTSQDCSQTKAASTDGS